MKTLLTLLSLIMFNSCAGAKLKDTKHNITSSNSLEPNQKKMISIEYQAVSRGYFLLISISNDGEYLTVATEPSMKPIRQSYTKEEWNQLMTALDNVNLDELPNLEAPSKKHQFDGAPIASIKITTGEKEYTTMAFDHGNPPSEIQEIVKILLSFTEKE